MTKDAGDQKKPYTFVAQGAEYELLSGGNDSALVLRFKTESLAVHLKGDDATRFQTDYETIKRQFPSWKPDQMLARLWDQGGYGWLAARDEYYRWAWLHW